MLLLGADKQALDAPQVIDLLNQRHSADGAPLEIVGSLEPEAYGIEIAGLQL
jgi:hypothetical protein